MGPYVSSTYVSVKATCPDSCAFKREGCYATAMNGYTFVATLDKTTLTALNVTRYESEAIDGMFPRGVPQDGYRGGRDLRLHVSGEVSCSKGARLLAGSATRWKERGGGDVWTYTSRWESIDRNDWGEISVLASVQSTDKARQAIQRGYAPAITLPYFPRDKAFIVDGLKIIPCPAETRGKTCATCRLCFDDGKIRSQNAVIGFALHGRGSSAARRALGVIQGDVFAGLPLELRP